MEAGPAASEDQGNLQSVSLPFPWLPLPGYLVPLSSLERERGRGRAPAGGGWAQGRSSLPQDFQELTCSPSPRLEAWVLGPLHLSKAARTLPKRKIRGRVRWGPRRPPSQAALQQARADPAQAASPFAHSAEPAVE